MYHQMVLIYQGDTSALTQKGTLKSEIRTSLAKPTKLTLEYISSLNINSIYPLVTAFYSQVVHLCVTQRDLGN